MEAIDRPESVTVDELTFTRLDGDRWLWEPAVSTLEAVSAIDKSLRRIEAAVTKRLEIRMALEAMVPQKAKKGHSHE